MVKKCVLLLCTLLAFSFVLLCPVVSLAKSSAVLASRNVSSGSQYATWSLSPSSGSISGWASSLVTRASDLGFSVAGWESIYTGTNGVYVQASYNWDFNADYAIYLNYTINKESETLANVGYNQNIEDRTTVAKYGTRVTWGTSSYFLDVEIISFRSPSTKSQMWYRGDVLFQGDGVYFSLPVFAPLFATTEEQMLELTEGISDKLDQIFDGLFSESPSDRSEVNSMEQEQQSIDKEVNSLLSDMSVGDISFEATVDDEVVSALSPPEGKTISDFLMSIPGFAVIMTTAVSLWVAAVILYGVRG